MASINYLSPANGSYVNAYVGFTLTAGADTFSTYDPQTSKCQIIFWRNDEYLSGSIFVYPNEYQSGRALFSIPTDGASLQPYGHTIEDVTHIQVSVTLVNLYNEYEYAGVNVTYYINHGPVITQQPQLTSPSAGSSGASTTMAWSAAQVVNQGNATIYYQYFVGPTSIYSDAYHVGTTTGLSHILTEAEIISKCGDGFGASASGSTCYLFVRAYWQKGQDSGGWTTPTGLAFTYFPTVNAPTNSSLSRSSGKDTSVSWTSQKAGNNSQPQSVLRIYRNNAWQNIAVGLTSSYAIVQSVWENYGVGTHTICIAHEYYGRYANGTSLTFEFAPDNTVTVYDGTSAIVCVAYAWNGSSWIQCDPYAYLNGQWLLCSTS